MLRNHLPLYTVPYCKPLLPYLSVLKVVQLFVRTPKLLGMLVSKKAQTVSTVWAEMCWH